MHRTDEERPAGERPASHVHVRRNTGMAVDDVSVLMKVCGAGRALAGRLADGARTKADEHQRHAELERVRDASRHFRAQHEEHGADGQQRQRMTESPARADERPLVAVTLARQQRRNGGEMIWFERVAHAEERAEPGARDEFEYWHHVAVARYLT